MDTQLAIYGLGACLASQTVLALVGIYQWHKWEKLCEKSWKDDNEDFHQLLKNSMTANRKVRELTTALFNQRALLFAWSEKAKRARQKTSHFVAARTLIDEALKND